MLYRAEGNHLFVSTSNRRVIELDGLTYLLLRYYAFRSLQQPALRQPSPATGGIEQNPWGAGPALRGLQRPGQLVLHFPRRPPRGQPTHFGGCRWVLKGENVLDVRQPWFKPVVLGSPTSPTFRPLYVPQDGIVANLGGINHALSRAAT